MPIETNMQDHFANTTIMAIICQMFIYENLPFNEDIDFLVPSGWRLCASSSSKLKTTLVVRCRKWMGPYGIYITPFLWC